MQSLERKKNCFGVFGRKALPVILHRDDPIGILFPPSDFDPRRRFGTPVFYGVPDEVLEDLPQVELGLNFRGKIPINDHRAGLFNRRPQIHNCGFERGHRRDRRRLFAPAGSGVGEQVANQRLQPLRAGTNQVDHVIAFGVATSILFSQ